MTNTPDFSAARRRAWVKCPICGEPDMRQEDGIITCTNLACPSNESPADQDDLNRFGDEGGN
jgi:hypothetical protein